MKEKRSQITIKGSSTEEKFKHIETMFRRMARRMNEKVVGIMPPSVIFHHVEKPDKDGIVLRGIIPAGEITKICLAIKKYNTNKTVRFICSLEEASGVGSQYGFETRKGLLVEDVKISVKDVGFFILRVAPGEVDPLIEDVWSTALFHFDQSESRVRTIMLGELEKLEALDEGI
jgi:hypothetical protein